jgi:dihydroorotase
MDRGIIIKNGHLIDPSQGIDGTGDVIIVGGKIANIVLKGGGTDSEKHGKDEIREPSVSGLEEIRSIDASGLYVLPGLIDMHAHLREPGFEYKETIATGTMAAVRGGFTSVCCMANTNPVNDNAAVTGFIVNRALEKGYCTVFPIGAITKGQRGEELAEMGLMYEAGAVAFSDDGMPLMNSLIMRRALEYSRMFNAPIISHCEDLNLSDGGVMHEGHLSASLGLRGVPHAAEEIMVMRDIILAELTGGRLHVAHVSTEGAVRLIRQAKERDISVTAETCPHYFTITEDAVKDYNTFAKVNPPLRTHRDITAIKEGLRDGTIDVIATDHAPHHKDEKLQEFDKAPFGISGFETALPLSLRLVEEGIITMQGLVQKMALNPAGILGLQKGTLRAGADADLVIVDAKREFEVKPDGFVSMGKNTPFGGWVLKGTAVVTLVKGRCNEFGQ